MEPIQPIDNQNLNRIIGNNPTSIPNLNNNRISGPSVISTIERPALRDVEAPVVRGLEVPVIDVPNTSINYPVINVPTQAEFDAAVKAEKEKKKYAKEDTISFVMKDTDPYAEPTWNWRAIATCKWPKIDYPHLAYLETVSWNDLTITMKNLLKKDLKPAP